MTNEQLTSGAFLQHEGARNSGYTADRAPRVLSDEDIPIGALVRQGDVYLQRVERVEARLRAYRSRQLAPGNAPGSRHTIEGKARLRRHLGPVSHLAGPVIFAASRIVLRHPQHASISLPAGIYQAYYQRRYMGEDSANSAAAAWD